ncbi:MAG TPA: ClpXP protease specificity-enhancing factor [Gammaproteobacteria bacterium]|nr:ClpXP protease specificity-enhancing factor [Gammaproteobacteria bacterium]
MVSGESHRVRAGDTPVAGAPPTSQRPYLLRAMHEWMVDNGLTPHLIVAARDGLELPAEHVKDGKIVLNVSYAATRDLALGNAMITFETRFGGVPRRLALPIDAVLGIYARENGQGMLFPDEPAPDAPPPSSDTPPPSGSAPAPSGDGGRPKLKVVK